METVGYIAPESVAEARDRYAEVRPIAKELVREIVVAMDVDRAEYEKLVTPEIVVIARDALFSSLLVVSTGERARFEAWCERPEVADFAVEIEGSQHVDRVAWHGSPLAETVLAATYHTERDAAIATLRRMAWGRMYHDVVRDAD